ncbi:hypothetical protein K470DRAFT_272006 [Piedraia hortae CBS 480.64]|uniref:Zinc finger PHD-type domain-containing protein n=1 Tax=Piedraia hortae CBS 480.64 TaxID=1314780 RepID=A0A6A7BUQ2_9PEZI|nr:hypothetical protein K470DRAFT_272006 [Piedraia hortae CBS 480.64]
MPSPGRRSTRANHQPQALRKAPASESSSNSRTNRPVRQVASASASAAGSRSSREGEDMGRQHEVQEEEDDDDDVTRCVCGSQDYPGPPLSGAFHGIDTQSEEVGGLFIQCDGCGVWQHGGCVGIVEESRTPDKYYCEECKPKEHSLQTDSRGQKHSIYAPVANKPKRKASVSRSDERARKEREAHITRASMDSVSVRRRATMRSKEHDVEEEQLRRALEESRRDANPDATKTNGKRSREGSGEEAKTDVKRQRTASISMTATEGASDDEGTAKAKKRRAEAAQMARQAEQREREKEREQARAEAAGRRQERAGRRRGDDPEPEETEIKRSQSPVPASPRRKGPGKKGKKAAQAAANGSPSKRRKAGGSSGDEVANGDGPAAAVENVAKSRFGKGRGKQNNSSRPEEPVEMTAAHMKKALDNMSLFIRQTAAEIGERGEVEGSSERKFDEMNSAEMAVMLERGIAEWNQQFAHLLDPAPAQT